MNRQSALSHLTSVIQYMRESERDDWQRHCQEGEDPRCHIYADVVCLGPLWRALNSDKDARLAQFGDMVLDLMSAYKNWDGDLLQDLALAAGRFGFYGEDEDGYFQRNDAGV